MPIAIATLIPALLALAAAALLWRRQRDGREAALRRAQLVDEEIRLLRTSIRQLEQQLAAATAAPEPSPAPAAPLASGINLNKRSLALRLIRRGDSTAEVAAAMGMTAAEVELLRKVHQVVIRRL